MTAHNALLQLAPTSGEGSDAPVAPAAAAAGTDAGAAAAAVHASAAGALAAAVAEGVRRNEWDGLKPCVAARRRRKRALASLPHTHTLARAVGFSGR